MPPIFIIGTERSGTNLLRLILNSHTRIAVPHPPHIMKFFKPLERSYGDLGNDRNFRRLIRDVCRLVELHPYPWTMSPDREKVFRQSADRSLISIYFQIYDQYREHEGKQRWACKSTFMIEHVGEVLAYHPESRFIFMVRDGRDVAVSAKSSIFNEYHVYFSAQRWKREQKLGLSWLSNLPAAQILLLKYEDLIKDPINVVRGVCKFLAEDFQEEMLEYYQSDEAKKSGGLSISWENTSRPVMVRNTGKFHSGLSREEILLFEAIAYKELSQLGYPLTHPLSELVTVDCERLKPRLKYTLTDSLLALNAQMRHLTGDSNSGMRMKKALYLNYLRTVRRVLPVRA